MVSEGSERRKGTVATANRALPKSAGTSRAPTANRAVAKSATADKARARTADKRT